MTEYCLRKPIILMLLLKIATRNDKNNIVINSISGYTPTLLEIAKNRNAKNIIAINNISGYIPILICP